MTADENSVIYYILDIIRKQCEEIRIRKESLSQSLILEGRMDVVAMMDVDLGEDWSVRGMRMGKRGWKWGSN